MPTIVPQVLRWLDDEFVIKGFRDPGDTVLWQVDAPDGRTVVARAKDVDAERWKGLYGDQSAHPVDLPGMLLSVLLPLAAVSCPVFVASTQAADIVLVPTQRADEAEGALRAAGHTVRA